MKKAEHVLGILKIGSREHMHAMHREGHLYMNTLHYFKTLEAKDRLRSDPSEGLMSSFPAEKMKVSIEGHEIKHLTGQVRFGQPNEDHIAIFSMYAITELTLPHIIDDRVFGFGDTAVVIMKSDEFTERINAECRRRSFDWKTDLVTYVDKNTHAGDMGPYRKYSDLDYQSEFRIAIKSGMAGPLADFRIGDISDISILCDSSELKTLLKITEKEK